MFSRSVPHLNHRNFSGEIVWSCHASHGLRHGLTHHAMFPVVKSTIFSGHLRPTCFFLKAPHLRRLVASTEAGGCGSNG